MSFLIETWQRLARGIAVKARTMSFTNATLLYLSALLILTPPWAAMFSSMGEPYPDLETYVIVALQANPYAAVYSLFYCGVVSQLICFFFLLFGCNIRLKHHHMLYYLSAFMVAIAMLPWSVFSAMTVFSHPYNTFTVSRPWWLDAWPIQVFGSWFWILAALVAWIALAETSKSAFYRISNPALCRNCFYDLTGNVSGTCPECGTPVESSQQDAL